jgi:type I restriction-modification system DNA methylase subunit
LTLTRKPETFSDLLNNFGYRYNTREIFEDFLTMAMCAVTPLPGSGKSHYEDLYLETIARYKDDEARHIFPKMFARLVLEMEENLHRSTGNDILGDTYQENFCRKNSGQFFTPWHICQLMAQITCGGQTAKDSPQKVIDPACGSGRTIITASKILGPHNEYYGIDIDHTCVKMTALNLFLNGVFGSEVMCADALLPGDFRISYNISLAPLGIFRIEEKEQSRLWQLQQNSFFRKESNEPPGDGNSPDKPQLRLF